MNNFIPFIFFYFILSLKIGICVKCLYRFVDPSGEVDSVHLSRITDKHVTIIGEHSFKYPEEVPDECTSITKQTIGNDGIWLSPFIEDEDEAGCCTSQQLECQKYRKSHENVEAYVKRVKNSCKKFIGVIRNVYCVSDKTTGVSYIQRITLSDHSFTTYLYGCGLAPSVQTPWGETIRLGNKLYIDVEKNIIKNTSEQSYSIIISTGLLVSICIAISLTLARTIQELYKKYPDSIIVKILMVLCFPLQIILFVISKVIIPLLPSGAFGFILNLIGSKGIRSTGSIRTHLPSIVRHIASANNHIMVHNIEERDRTLAGNEENPKPSLSNTTRNNTTSEQPASLDDVTTVL